MERNLRDDLDMRGRPAPRGARAHPPATEPPLAAPERLRKLVDAHLDFVWRSLRRLGVDASAVDDAAQQVFWIAYQKLEQILPGSERPFLYGTALRVASEARRVQDRRKDREAPTDIETWPDDLPLLDEMVDLRRARDVLDRILDRMPFDLRTVFVLTEAEGLTAADVSELLEIPVGTVASRLRRAREIFERGVRSVQQRMRHGKGAP